MNLGYSLSWRWQDKVGLQHPEEKNFVLGLAYAWWNWTVRRPTPMTTWKPRSRVTSTRSTWNPTMTWHTWGTREHARSVSLLSSCSVWVVTLIPCTHRVAQDVRVFVSSHPCMKWAFRLTSLISSSPSSSFSHSSTSSSSCCPSTSTRLSAKIPCASSPRRWSQLTSPSPTQVFCPRTTSSRRLTSCPSQSPDRATIFRATVPRGRGLRWCRDRWDALQCIPRTSLSLPARRPVCWSVVVVRVREIGATRCRKRSGAKHWTRTD